MKQYDLIVLGAGTAGMNLIRTVAARGWSTALVESGHLGGTCINVGCIPSKALISSSRVLQTVRDAAAYGVTAPAPVANWPAMVARKAALVERIRGRSSRNVESDPHIQLYGGPGVFTSPRTVEVLGETLTAERIVIATGARSAIPPVPGLDSVDYLTSTSAMELGQLPESLFILGGGIIALEFSQLFARLGVAVTILQRGPHLATNLELEISEEIRQQLKAEGVTVRTDTNIRSISSRGGWVEVVDDRPQGPRSSQAEQLLVATGRRPNSDGMGLEPAGVKTDQRGYIVVNEDFSTGVEGIWALGDVIGGMMFTHKARHDALLLSRHFLEGRDIASSDRLIPFAVFTDPEIAGVGLGEKAARAAGHSVRIQRFPFAFHGRALAEGKVAGFIKLVLDQTSGRLLGAHIIGPEAGELIHELIMAMRFGGTVEDLQDMIHVHPTLTEAINSTAWVK